MHICKEKEQNTSRNTELQLWILSLPGLSLVIKLFPVLLSGCRHHSGFRIRINGILHCLICDFPSNTHILLRVIVTRPQLLNFLWAPHKLVSRRIVQKGKLDETPALSLIEDSKHEVAEDTVLDVWKLFLDERLLQKEADQRGLIVTVSQGSQALQDAGDAQVVVCVTVKQMIIKEIS